MIVFLHMHKTGGNSLRQSIRLAYKKRVAWDYSMGTTSDKDTIKPTFAAIPIALPGFKWTEEEFEGYDIVYGHLVLSRYFHLKNVEYCSFFRDPIDRMCSQYFNFLLKPFYKNTKIKNKQYYDIRDGMSLLEFAESDIQRNYYEIMLDGLSVLDLSFIGITELYKESIKKFQKKFGVKLQPFKQNINPKRQDKNFIDYKMTLQNEGIYEEVFAAQRNNREIYNQALERFRDI